MSLEQTWRWFGPTDAVRLEFVKQTGATGIVTALHHIPTGEVWEKSEIEKRKLEIENVGLKWVVAESIPVHENIKTRSGNYKQYLENYKRSLLNLGDLGVKTVCYNFMPVLDATRTNFYAPLPNGSTALLYDAIALATFDLFLLKRPGAAKQYSEFQQEQAVKYLQALTSAQTDHLIATVVAGFPGIGVDYTLAQFQKALDPYEEIGPKELKENLKNFINTIVPLAEEAEINLAIHPDDPPFPVLGLPRVVSTEADLKEIITAKNVSNNGVCFCTGSLGVIANNDLGGMVKRLGHRINFVHLRSTKRIGNGSFYESDHLEGDVNMYGIIKALLEEQKERKLQGRKDYNLTMRPDHGHQMLDDLGKKTVPGYSAIGRLRGLSEIRGLELAIRKAFAL